MVNIVKSTNTSDALIPFDPNSLPEHLRGENAGGIKGLDQSDYKLPRIKLLQGLSPEIRANPGVALPDHFWHSGASINLGRSFHFIPASACKRVILWSSRDTGAKLLAYSKDGRTWTMGGNSEFTIQGKDGPPVTVKTGRDVQSSGLLEWGSSQPGNPKAPPAATLIYEYLCYLPEHPELSPCIMGMYRTATESARKLNTALLSMRKPITSVVVNCTALEERSNNNTWSIPNFKLAGWAKAADYELAKQLAKEYEAYNAEYTSDEIHDTATSNSTSKSSVVMKDDIPF